MRLICEDTGEVAESYSAYRRTRHWKTFRETYLRQIDPCACENCGVTASKQPLQLHHMTYERIGREESYDVIALCWNCHKCLHGGSGKNALRSPFTQQAGEARAFPISLVTLAALLDMKHHDVALARRRGEFDPYTLVSIRQYVAMRLSATDKKK